jgi:hypothetical protein
MCRPTSPIPALQFGCSGGSMGNTSHAGNDTVWPSAFKTWYCSTMANSSSVSSVSSVSSSSSSDDDDPLSSDHLVRRLTLFCAALNTSAMLTTASLGVGALRCLLDPLVAPPANTPANTWALLSATTFSVVNLCLACGWGSGLGVAWQFAGAIKKPVHSKQNPAFCWSRTSTLMDFVGGGGAVPTGWGGG